MLCVRSCSLRLRFTLNQIVTCFHSLSPSHFDSGRTSTTTRIGGTSRSLRSRDAAETTHDPVPRRLGALFARAVLPDRVVIVIRPLDIVNRYSIVTVTVTLAVPGMSLSLKTQIETTTLITLILMEATPHGKRIMAHGQAVYCKSSRSEQY